MDIAFAVLNPIVGDMEGNTSQILDELRRARASGAQLLLCCELAICGYPPEDLLFSSALVTHCHTQLQRIIDASGGMAVVVGLPRIEDGLLYNSAAVIEDGHLLGFQDKLLIPTYDVFDEKRYFASGKKLRLWELLGQRIAITICEDIWQHGGAVPGVGYPQDPIVEYAALKPDLLLNLSASPFSIGRSLLRRDISQSVAKTLSCPVYLCNQGGANGSLIFNGETIAVDPKGNVERTTSFFPDTEMESVYQALVLGVRDYFHKQGFEQACLGLSGGIDSAVVACIAVDALGGDNVTAVAMPSRYSSPESLEDAQACALALGIKLREVSIEDPFQSCLELLEPQWKGYSPNIAEENLQARIRGMLLMALSNKFGGLVLTTGNKSEMAMGYATLYGDMCGALGVLADVTKHRVYALGRVANALTKRIPERVFQKAPSAELRPNQKDSDSLPDYSVIDAVVEGYIEQGLDAEKIAERESIDRALVQELIRRIHMNEYKRCQAPLGLRVTSKAFSRGWRYPIVAKWESL